MLERQKWKLIIPFIVPGLVLYSVFVMYPSLRGIYVSFFKWTGLTMNMKFVGFANFAKLWRELTDPQDFYLVRLYLSHNVFLFVVSLFTIFAALVVAALINNKPRGHQAFRVTYFFPNVLSTVAIAVLWSMILNPSFGLLNNVLRFIGLEALALPWLSMQMDAPIFKLGLYSVGFISLWASLGWFMILFLASIQNIPIELIEAAHIDGANKVRVFWSITVPLIWETVRTVSVFAVIGALNGFALNYVLFERTANKHADLILTYYYYQAFTNYNWGYAAAIVVGIFLVSLAATIATYRFIGRETVTY